MWTTEKKTGKYNIQHLRNLKKRSPSEVTPLLKNISYSILWNKQVKICSLTFEVEIRRYDTNIPISKMIVSFSKSHLDGVEWSNLLITKKSV